MTYNPYSYSFGEDMSDTTKVFPLIIKKELGWKQINCPQFLKKYKWKPEEVYKKGKFTILIDFVSDDNFPHLIYKKEIPKILKENKNVRFCVFLDNESKYKDIQKICEKFNYGLKWICWVDITTILLLDFESGDEKKKPEIIDDNWFPKAVLDEILSLKRLSYLSILKEFAEVYHSLNDKESKFRLITKTIQKLINSEKKFVANKKSFVNLSHFEKILGDADINSEHTFHSFRVFLIGCIIIDNYYDLFVDKFKKFAPGVTNFSIEYIWLLSAIFHDIGHIKNKYEAYLGIDTNEDFEEALNKAIGERWNQEEYKKARSHIVCLLSKLSSQKNIKTAFSGLGDYHTEPEYEKNENAENYLIMNYNRLKCHSVLSCFDLTAEVLKEVQLIGGDPDKAEGFLCHHLYVAALSICYHDWHLWKTLREYKIFPLSFERYPFAALLIYIDTWDDYKRSCDRHIEIVKFIKNKKSFVVNINWPDKKQYEKEKIKYKNYKKNILFKSFSLIINVENEK